MVKTIFLLIMVIFNGIISGKEVNVITVENNNKMLKPGNAYSFVFNIQNFSTEELEFTPSVSLPSNWRDLGVADDFLVPAGSNEIQIINVFIPPQISGGEYSISYTAYFNNGKDSVFCSKNIVVEDVKNIQLELIDAPSYILAGNRAMAKFRVINSGNISETIRLSSVNCKLKTEANIFLEVGESKVVEVYSDIDKNLKKNTSTVFILNAQINDIVYSGDKISASTQLILIPNNEKGEDRFFRFPVNLAIEYLRREKSNISRFGWQGEISGKGFIDTSKKRHLEFKGRGPSRFNMSALGQYDEYYVKYKSPAISVFLGDKNYQATQLSEYSRYGRGLELYYKINGFSFGGFVNVPRFYSGISQEYKGSIQFEVKNNLFVNTTYFAKKNTDSENIVHVASLATHYNLLKYFRFETEYTLSVHEGIIGHGALLKGEVSKNNFRTSFQYFRTDENYTGYYTDATQISLYTSYKLSRRINFSGNIHSDATNTKLDTLYGANPANKNYRLALNYQYVKNGSLLLSGGQRESKDRNENTLFHYKDNFFSGNISKRIGRFELSSEITFAKTNNLLTTNKGRSLDCGISANYNRKGLDVSLFGNWDRTIKYSENTIEQLYYGFKFRYHNNSKTIVNLNFQNAFSIEEYYRDRSLFSASLKQIVNRNHFFEVAANYSLVRKKVDVKDFSVALKYGLKINVPVKKIAEYGSLEGKIEDLGSHCISGVGLVCGGHKTISKEDGTFIIKNLKPGKHYLFLDRTSMNITDIANVEQPLKIEIKPGKNSFSFGMTTASAIKGRVILSEQNQALNEFLQIPGNKSNSVIVEISREKEIHRQLVPLNGSFSFDYLIPSNWNLKVYSSEIQEEYFIETDLFNISLEPGETSDIEIKISKKEKEIKFLQQDRIVMGQ